jgi:hypothetical protein
MNAEESVQASMTLLERMAEEPRAVLETLNPTEQERVITELGVLAERAAGVQAEADLLYVADAVHRMVEETPALGVLLLPDEVPVDAAQEQQPTTRKITATYDEAAYRKSRHAQERAAQIRNRVVECRQRLERALRE